MSASRRRPGGERGQSSLLIVGFFLVAVLLVAVVVDASAAYLRRMELNALADGAALAAADGARGAQVYTQGLGDHVAIDPTAARGGAATYLAQVRAHEEFRGLVAHVTTRGDAVTVRLAAPLDLPIPPPGWTEVTWVEAAATAVVPVG